MYEYFARKYYYTRTAEPRVRTWNQQCCSLFLHILVCKDWFCVFVRQNAGCENDFGYSVPQYVASVSEAPDSLSFRVGGGRLVGIWKPGFVYNSSTAGRYCYSCVLATCDQVLLCTAVLSHCLLLFVCMNACICVLSSDLGVIYCGEHTRLQGRRVNSEYRRQHSNTPTQA